MAVRCLISHHSGTYTSRIEGRSEVFRMRAVHGEHDGGPVRFHAAQGVEERVDDDLGPVHVVAGIDAVQVRVVEQATQRAPFVLTHACGGRCQADDRASVLQGLADYSMPGTGRRVVCFIENHDHIVATQQPLHRWHVTAQGTHGCHGNVEVVAGDRGAGGVAAADESQPKPLLSVLQGWCLLDESLRRLSQQFLAMCQPQHLPTGSNMVPDEPRDSRLGFA
ncbi:Uncharacterised protein [Mycobacteroides abscessus subsp. abscessus]|nr:Uncharacterised protein [Mycobacteroides abscessus subsp. abscessus]